MGRAASRAGRGVTYIDADAFGALIEAQREVSELGGRLVLAGIWDMVQGYRG